MRVDAVVADELGAVDAVAGGGLGVIAAVALLLARQCACATHTTLATLWRPLQRRVRRVPHRTCISASNDTTTVK